MMENTAVREFLVPTSGCDAGGRLGIDSVFDIFMDMAALHAEQLGVGYRDMLACRCIWVAVRTRVRLYARPGLGEAITAETWPGKAGPAKMDRFCRLSQGGRVLAEGRTEWGVQDVDTGLVRRTSSFPYPTGLICRPERVCGEPFRRFVDADPAGLAPVCEYTVRSTDIDLGRHMNNVAYLRMLLGTFSTEELEGLDFSEVELFYRRACFEGERLRVLRRREGQDLLFQVARPTGETAVHALFRPRHSEI